MEKHYRKRDTIPSDRRGYSCRKNNEIKLKRAFVLIILLNIGGWGEGYLPCYYSVR